MSGERKRGFIRPGTDDATVTPQRWGLPDYGAESNKAAKQTAFNYDPGWIPNFDEPEQVVEHEFSEEEIALIRTAAQQEGFEAGKQKAISKALNKVRLKVSKLVIKKGKRKVIKMALPKGKP